jgi:hypothetical protein
MGIGPTVSVREDRGVHNRLLLANDENNFHRKENAEDGF